MIFERYDADGRLLSGSEALAAAAAFYPAKQELFITSLSPECMGLDLMAVDNGLASGTLTQNTLYAVPLALDADFVVKRIFWANGTVSNGNCDAGIYNWAGTSKLVSAGATGQGTVSVLQSVDCADTTLTGGYRYWMVFGMDSASGTYVRAQYPAAPLGAYASGAQNQTSGYSSGLPSSLTLAIPAVTAFPLFGITGYTVS